MKKILIVLFVIFLVFLFGYIGLFPFTPEFKNSKGRVLSRSIASLEIKELGNLEQWILIRGQDISNPILLWLHGGPGATLMPFSHYIDKELEKEFIVVHWDQRGAGKTNNFGADTESLKFDQFKNDTLELIQYLLKKFNKKKIFLVGHSWGAYLGIHIAKNYSDKFHAYIGIGQPVDNFRQQQISYDWLSNKISESGKTKYKKKLQELGPPPYLKQKKYIEFINLINNVGGGYKKTRWELFLIALKAHEYNFIDYIKWWDGAKRGGGPMWDEIWSSRFNLKNKIYSLDVPIYFFNGKNDYNTSVELVEEYYEEISAPAKELIIFEKSAHLPFIAEREKFSEELIQIKNENYLVEKN